MARITKRQQIPPVTINTFLGLNESKDGNTELKLGEASRQENWRITDGGKLTKMEGYKPLFPSLGDKKIQGQWYGVIGTTTYHVFSYGGKLYYTNNGVNTEIGTITDNQTTFFFFQEKLYIMDGNDLYSWDGTTLKSVTGYRPLIATETPPDGGGTLFEELNRINGLRHQTFSPTGSKTVYHLAEKGITSVDFVIVDGVTKTVTTDYTVNLTDGTVTFLVAPSEGTPDSVDIGWTTTNTDRDSIVKCLYATLYGGANDSRVFIYSNSGNTIYYSGLADGLPSAEYWPSNSIIQVGSDEFPVTGACKQYDKMIIFTTKGSYYTAYEMTNLPDGSSVASFPVYSINATKGNIAPGQAKNILNDPFAVFEGVYSWALVNSFNDARNAVWMSKRVQPSLDLVDLSKAVTADYEKMGEYWLCVDSTCWIYNYRTDVWYKRTNVQASNFIEIEGEFYFGTVGTIMKFDSDVRTDNGTVINAVWQMGFYDFEAAYLLKYMINEWISLKPESKTLVTAKIITNSDGESEPQIIKYNLLNFVHCDFNHFSFNNSYNPQPFRVDLPVMGFDYLMFVLTNDSDIDMATVLSITMPVRFGGKVS